MYHSITISDKNTYDDWRMIPTSRPYVALPEPRLYFVEVPGRDGALDYTDVLTGAANYGMRKGSWEFYLRPGYGWVNIYASISDYLHGQRHTIILEDDPSYHYTGRLSINSWKSDKKNSLITIDYYLDPYKLDANNQNPAL